MTLLEEYWSKLHPWKCIDVDSLGAIFCHSNRHNFVWSEFGFTQFTLNLNCQSTA
jgi:hypothetical protein